MNFFSKITREFKGESVIAFPEEYVVIDLETTGFSSFFDDIIEIGALKVKNNTIIDTFTTLVKPEDEIDDFIINLTGITNEMLSDAPTIQKILPALNSFIDNSILVGHNVSFDVNFLYDRYNDILGKPFENNFVDTMRIFRKLYKNLEHHRLVDMVDTFGLKVKRFHRAEDDCNATFSCFKLMKEQCLKEYSSLDDFAKTFKKRSCPDISSIVSTNDDFDTDNIFYKKVCAFTGALEKMPRKEAMQLIVNCGGIVGNGVTNKTNFLILGNNDYCKAIKDGKSNKQKKAEELISKGNDLKIIDENTFYDIIEI